MADAAFHGDEPRRWRRYVVPALLALAAAWLIWTFAHQEGGVRREAPEVSTIIPVEETPPPPPPKVPPPPQPTPVEQTLPTPTAQPTPQPPTPSPAQPTPGQSAVSENAPAQAGSDAFNIGAGPGGGMRGAGFIGGETAGAYGQYVRGRILEAFRSDGQLRGKQFRAEVSVWLDGSGRVTRVEVAKGSGVAAYDAELKRVLATLDGFRAPVAGVLMPIHFTMDERTPL
jgi:protein TonB